jgi:lipopolysaccharide/colanic/teichoic acid biosynthesis glycosyltransferase
MKRVIDIVISATALILLSPVLFAIAGLVWGEDGAPVLFRQGRVGRGGQTFEILKFRTMRREPGAPITASGDPRITRVGAFLRRWKLDELPQLWNVLRGEMSLVGPRPEIPRYVRLYSVEEREVLQVRPGITGPAQIVGLDEEEELRGAADPDRLYREVLLPRKLEIDRAYARNGGLRTDLRIVFATFRRMVLRHGRGSHVALG